MISTMTRPSVRNRNWNVWIRKRGKSVAPVLSTMWQRRWITNFTDAEEYETFSGFLIGKLGEIPKDGSRLKLEIEGYLIRILNVRQHCVEKAIVRVADTAPAAES